MDFMKKAKYLRDFLAMDKPSLGAWDKGWLNVRHKNQQPPQVDEMERTDRARTRTWPRMNGFRSECGSDDAPDHSTAQASSALAAGRARGPAP